MDLAHCASTAGIYEPVKQAAVRAGSSSTGLPFGAASDSRPDGCRGGSRSFGRLDAVADRQVQVLLLRLMQAKDRFQAVEQSLEIRPVIAVRALGRQIVDESIEQPREPEDLLVRPVHRRGRVV